MSHKLMYFIGNSNSSTELNSEETPIPAEPTEPTNPESPTESDTNP